MQTEALQPKKTLFPLALLFLWWLVLRVVFFQGFWNSDDWYHLHYAYRWGQLPANQLEARLFFNLLLHAASTVFGFRPIAWAFPGLVFSLALTGTTCWLAFRTQGRRQAVVAGLLVACFPADVILSTVAFSTPVSGALVGFATAILFRTTSRRGLAAAILCGAFSVLAHPIGVFFVLALGATLFLFGDRRRGLEFAVFTVTVYFLLEFALNAAVTGDPLHGMRVLSAWHAGPDPARSHPIQWLLAPWINFLFSKDFGFAPAGALLCFLHPAVRRSQVCRMLLVYFVLVWLWFSYGTAKPYEYALFWRLTRFYHGLILPFAVILSTALCGTRRLLVPGTALVCLVNVGLLAASGSWGQADDICRELLPYLKQHPEAALVTDAHSVRAFAFWNGLRPVPNVRPIAEMPEMDRDRPVYFFYNPLYRNLADHELSKVLAGGSQVLRCGPAVVRTMPRFRSIAYLLPRQLRSRYPFLLRRPAGIVSPIVSGNPDSGAPEEPGGMPCVP